MEACWLLIVIYIVGVVDENVIWLGLWMKIVLFVFEFA